MARYHLNQPAHCGDPSGRRERGGRIFVKIMPKFPNLMKYVTIKLQKAQWTPGKMSSETHSKTLLKGFENKNKRPITYKDHSVRLSGIFLWQFHGSECTEFLYSKCQKEKNEGGWWVSLMEECSPSIRKSPGSTFMTSFCLFWKPSLWYRRYWESQINERLDVHCL